ncbi:MAG: metallophosphoesterase [Clostridia bacterium]|nr:metallophosphoesterase [Clostridia bacterium]
MRSNGIPAKLVSLLTAALYLFLGAVNGVMLAGKRYSPENKAELRLNAVLTADIHVDSDPLHPRNVLLMKLLAGIGKSDAPVDALVLAGDSANLAEQKEYGFLKAMLRLYNRTGCVVPSMGNHDSGSTSMGKDCEKTFGTTCESFRDFQRFCGIDSDTNYYVRVVNGYHFIVIGTDEMRDNGDPVLHEAQLAWLDESLSAAAGTGKPVFIVGHEPIFFNGGFTGEYIRSDGTPSGIEGIIQRYTDAGTVVLFIGGHRHDPFTPGCFMNPSENFYCIDLPTSTKNEDEPDKNGEAAALEVYGDRLVVRPRNYISGEWYGYRFEVPLR